LRKGVRGQFPDADDGGLPQDELRTEQQIDYAQDPMAEDRQKRAYDAFRDAFTEDQRDPKAAKRTLEFNSDVYNYEAYQGISAELEAEAAAEAGSAVAPVIPPEIIIPVEPIPVPVLSESETEEEEEEEEYVEGTHVFTHSETDHVNEINQFIYDNHTLLDPFQNRENLITSPWSYLAGSDTQSDYDGTNHRFVSDVTTNYQTSTWDLLFVQYDATGVTPIKWLMIHGEKLNDYSASSWISQYVKIGGLVWYGGSYLHQYRWEGYDAEPIIHIDDNSSIGNLSWPGVSLFHDHPNAGSMGWDYFDGLRRVYIRPRDVGGGFDPTLIQAP